MIPGDPKERREEVASVIAAREHATIIAETVRNKLHRYIELEIFSTQKDDHTASLSERVTILETELGKIREEQRAFLDNVRWREQHGTWWHHVKYLFSRRRWR